MKKPKITLADIGLREGVSPSTVQRALNGLKGVGDARRDRIRKTAKEMGYKRNLTASVLKTGSRTIGIVLPEAVGNNRFYARYLWEGALRCAGEYKDFNLDVAEFPYVRTPEELAAKLREVLDSHADKLDALLTMGENHPAARGAYAGFKARNIPIAFVGTDARSEDRMCCVRTYDEMAGRMAADLLINFVHPRKHGKVVMTGDFAIPDQFLNALGFERHVYENQAPYEIVKLPNETDPDAVKKNIMETLGGGRDILAVYATSPRNTVPACEAAAESGSGARIIGSDIFPESVEFLRRNVLNAIIHKRPAHQAHHAMRILVNAAVKGEPPARDVVLIDSVVVMKSNLEGFAQPPPRETATQSVPAFA